jgi:mRNA-degrading endonuclease RelE of RelBE toxin-antitoxin system
MAIALRAAMPYDWGVHSVLETAVFSRDADSLLRRGERDALISALAANPLQGDLVPGLGGVRKMRCAAGGRGKSGAFRVVYYLASDEQPILALIIYGKNEQANPSPGQRKAMLAAVELMKKGAKARRQKGT